MKAIAYGSFVLSVFLFATYYAASREALARTDAMMLTWMECLYVLPVGVTILFVTRKRLTHEVLRRGAILGGVLCLMLFSLALALQDTSATETAFFPCLQAIFAALFARIGYRQSISLRTWLAAGCAVTGMALMVGSHVQLAAWRGDAGALLGALLYTGYIFLVDALLVQQEQAREMAMPVVGAQFVALGVLASVLTLLFGNGQVHLQLPKDVYAIEYVGWIIVLSTIISALMQRYVDAVTVSFISILEPVAGSIVAFVYLGERFPAQSYVGYGFVFLGVLLQTVASAVLKSVRTHAQGGTSSGALPR